MALSTTVTKVSAVETAPASGEFSITYKLLYKDGDTVLIEKNYTLPFKPKNSWATLITAPMRAMMKADIASYKAGEAIFNGAPIAASVQNLNDTVGT